MSLSSGFSRPSFLITIDTEGDNLWSRPRDITTENSRYLPRFQELCERYGFKPTYLTNYEMAKCPVFQEFARDACKRNQAEVGMHLHGWNSPPAQPLTTDDFTFQPFLIEYSDAQMRDKIAVMTELLETTLERKMRSHRAGRWAFDERYARYLVDFGYRVDCSVTPGFSWRDVKGDPNGQGGTDYTGFPDRAYVMDLNDLAQENTTATDGADFLLQVPMTVRAANSKLADKLDHLQRNGPRGVRRLVRHLAPRFPRFVWLRPNGNNLRQMQQIVNAAHNEQRDYVEFMLHSSEFMPGNKNFPDERSIEVLYEHLAALFESAAKNFQGAALHEYCEEFCTKHKLGTRSTLPVA